MNYYLLLRQLKMEISKKMTPSLQYYSLNIFKFFQLQINGSYTVRSALVPSIL